TLLTDSAESIAEIDSAHVALETNGEVPNLPVTSLDGDLRRSDGRIVAKGSGKMQQMGQLVEVEFVLTGDTLYLKGPTGDFQKLPSSVSSAMYDPSTLLDPDTGIAKVLRNVQDPETMSNEQVQDTPTFKVTGTVPGNVIGELVPGVSDQAEATFWLAENDDHRPVKATVEFPETNGQEEPGTVTITLSEVNEPVTVDPPA